MCSVSLGAYSYGISFALQGGAGNVVSIKMLDIWADTVFPGDVRHDLMIFQISIEKINNRFNTFVSFSIYSSVHF